MQAFPRYFPAEINLMAPPKMKRPEPAHRNFPLILASISLVATVVGVPIAFLAWIEPHLQNDQKNQITIEVGNQLKEPLFRMQETNTHLAGIEGSLNDLKPFIHDVINRQFENVSKLPTQVLLEHFRK